MTPPGAADRIFAAHLRGLGCAPPVVTRVLVLGAGFGGLELATVVAQRCGAEVELTLIDQAEGSSSGSPSWTSMFGRAQPDKVLHRYADLTNPGVRFVSAAVTAIPGEAADGGGGIDE